MTSTIAVTILAIGWCNLAPAQTVPQFSTLQPAQSRLGATSPPLLALLTLNPAVAQSGVTVAQGTVWLGSAAPPSGAIVTLNIADSTAAAPAAPTIFVLPGTTSAAFSIFANPVAAPVLTTVSATYDSITRAATLTVLPPPPSPVLASLTLDRPAAFGSPADTSVNFAIGTVTLTTSPVGAGIVVALTSSNPALASLSSSKVMVGPGQTLNRFTITAPQPVTSDTPVTISATYQGVTKTVTLTMLKPQDSLDLWPGVR